MTYEPAPFGRRLLARILDLAFALILTFVLAIPVGLAMFPFVPLVDRNSWAALAAALCYFLAYVALEFFLLIRRNGQTLGKGLLGLRVVSSAEQNPSGDLSVLTALTRLVILFAPFVFGSVSGGHPNVPLWQSLGNFAFVALIVSLALAALPKFGRRALHDYASQTRVVRAAKRGLNFRQDVRMMVPGKIDMTKRLT